MADQDNDKDKKTLKMSKPNTLSLTKTVEGGKVKQNFSRGKSKTVTVEVKKTRTFARSADDGKMRAVPKPGGVKAGGGRYLTAEEREARKKALEGAEDKKIISDIPRPPKPKKKEEPEAEAPKEAEAKKEEAAPVMDDMAAKNLEAMKSAPPRPVPAGPKKTEEKKEDDKPERKQIKLKSDAGRRQSGKLTISQALSMGEERTRSLASIKRQRAKAHRDDEPKEKISREVIIPETITVQELANRMAERVAVVIKELMKLGTMATAQQAIDADTAELIVGELGHTFKRVSAGDVEDRLTKLAAEEDDAGDLQTRPAVVTVMGHVDHGKTSLLDALRKTDVVAGEAGGITQHIGAYQVTLTSGDRISFLDTPGHAAFTAMRARGAQATDIVILVVAADDGIMPQTEEAISHAKAAGVPIIVAINKMDKPEADAERVRNMLMNYELVAEEFGGDIMCVEVSAKAGTNLDKLEEAVLLQAEMLELKANPNRAATGVTIESKVDKGRGTVATLLIQRGTLKVGDIVVAGGSYGKIRAITDDKGRQLKEAGPSLPVEVLGLGEPPSAGDEFAVVESEKEARDITEYRLKKEKDLQVIASAKTMDQLFAGAAGRAADEMPIIIKADVNGSAEAIIGSLGKFSDEEVKVKVLHSAVGGISESDVTLAQATGAIIMGFNVRAAAAAKQLAEKEGVEIRYYSVIYDLIDDVKAALSGMLSPDLRENLLGYAEIREVFNITKVGKVGGCMVTDGMIKRGAKVRLLRDNVVIHEGTLKTLKRFKEEVKEVNSGYECGMAFENYEDIKAGDQIEAFEMEEIAREISEKTEEKPAKEA